MRIPLFSMFITSPFDGLEEHAAKIKECAEAFQEAIECHVSKECLRFEELRREVSRLESEADAIKRRIRGHLPKGTMLPVDKFQLFRYIREQDHVLDALQHSLDWISYYPEPGIPEMLQKDFILFVDAVLNPIDELSHMVKEARGYFKSFSESKRVQVKEIISTLRRFEKEADQHEDAIKRKIFSLNLDGAAVFHLVRLAEILGSIADHAENTGDMMRAMVAR
jgi:predicted phosphate transport protein (TIGR00153 family)